MSKYYLDLTNFSMARLGNKQRRAKKKAMTYTKKELDKELHNDRVKRTQDLIDRMKSRKYLDVAAPRISDRRRDRRSEGLQ